MDPPTTTPVPPAIYQCQRCPAIRAGLLAIIRHTKRMHPEAFR